MLTKCPACFSLNVISEPAGVYSQDYTLTTQCSACPALLEVKFRIRVVGGIKTKEVKENETYTSVSEG